MNILNRRTPAKKWEEAFPIGNGSLGAMIPGGIYREDIWLNQDSIWYGAPADRVNKDAKENLPKIRELIFNGQIREAEALMKYTLAATPESQRQYQPLGKLGCIYEWDTAEQITYDALGKPLIDSDRLFEEGIVKDYSLSLDIDNAIVSEQYRINGHNVSKKYYSSNPAGVMIMEIEADIKCNMTFYMTRGRYYDSSGKFNDHTVYIDGQLGSNGISFIAGLSAVKTDGIVMVRGDHLLITGAKNAVIVIGCETSFYYDNYREIFANKFKKIENVVMNDSLAVEGIRNEHISDYKNLYDRLKLNINDDKFAQTYYQYCRYLMISGSRPGTLPLNLQGIWNDSMDPPWDSKYTININAQMNYWPTDICGLSECYEPFFDHLLRVSDRGKKVAEKMYGCRGFVAHHNTDIWGDSAPQDIYLPASFWMLGGAWLSTHIMMHYEYTEDKEFLEKMYPVLRDSVIFFADSMIEHEDRLVVCPSVSPENTYILPSGERGCACYGATMDSEILRDLFEGYIKAADVLGRDEELLTKTKEMLDKLPELQIGKHGQIMEWMKDYEELEPGHRHISHLYGLHPSHQIDVMDTPKLAEAALKTLERRLKYGGGHTGWSCAWIVNFYVRLNKGEEAYENLRKLWDKSTFPNLMDNHPRGNGFVFQIDGNFGALNAMTEMMLQSNKDRIIILPALPKAWPSGNVDGIRFPGGIAGCSWDEKGLTEFRIEAIKTGTYKLYYENKLKVLALNKGEKMTIDRKNFI